MLAWYEGSGLTSQRNLHTNHQGSIIAVADGSGAALALNSYDAYGIPAATNLGRFAYTGQIMLPELGLYYYKARLYSPTLGRFLQTDPIGYKDDIDLYAYVGNDPVNKSDPTGLANASLSDPCGVKGGEASAICKSCSGECSGENGTGTGGLPSLTTRAVDNFYAGRAAQGDEYASLALQFGQQNPLDSNVAQAQRELLRALLLKNGGEPGGMSRLDVKYDRRTEIAARNEYRQIREQLAKAYEGALNSTRQTTLNPGQIYDFHRGVFESHGLGPSTFGGSQFTGTRIESFVFSAAWCFQCFLNTFK